MSNAKKETRLFAIAGFVAFLNIAAHFMGSKMFKDFPMTEITLAAIPFLMLALCWWAFKIAEKE